MAYIKGERKQLMLLPQAIEDYVAVDDPVRAYDAFVEALDFNRLGIVIDTSQSGANSYWPKAMLKLLVYGYTYGIRSSRKLERACYHNLSFIWLIDGIKPDYRTIARFRINNKEALKNVLKQCVQMCLKLDLIEGNTLFVDGTKIKANASLANTWSQKDCQEYLNKISKNIETILNECDSVDKNEENTGSLVKLKEELKNQEILSAKVKEIANELKTSGEAYINTTDPESIKSKSDRGAKMYHNSQITVDKKNGLIVNIDVIASEADQGQLSNQIKQAQAVMDKKPKVVCADAGYHSIQDIEKTNPSVMVVVPSPMQIAKERTPKKMKQFPKDRFRYDEKHDCYICPENKELQLTNSMIPGRPNSIIYQAHGRDCKSCKHFGICTASINGRKIVRLKNEALLQRLAQVYASAVGQEIYKLRKQKAELPFAHFKHNMNVRQFLLRGVKKVTAELSLCAIGYNLTRMVSLLGVNKAEKAFLIA
jgi:transposase